MAESPKFKWPVPQADTEVLQEGGNLFTRPWYKFLRDLRLMALPIGTVLPWLKSLTNVPDLPVGFVECSGQTLSDEFSPLDGQTIPDLNGDNRFLRGNSTSGGTGTFDVGGSTFDYYDVVWIMRVR